MRNHVGEERFSLMTEQELLESAIKLVNLMRIIYKPVTEEEYVEVTKLRMETLLSKK